MTLIPFILMAVTSSGGSCTSRSIRGQIVPGTQGQPPTNSSWSSNDTPSAAAPGVPARYRGTKPYPRPAARTETWAVDTASCRGKSPEQCLGGWRSWSSHSTDELGKRNISGWHSTVTKISSKKSGRFRKVSLWYGLQPFGTSSHPR